MGRNSFLRQTASANYSKPSVDEVVDDVLQQQLLLLKPEDVEQLKQFRENFKAVNGGVQTWNQFQTATSGVFETRTQAAAGWEAYQRSNHSTDTLIIGNLDDTQAVQNWPDHQVLNIQGWSIGANDAWVQGGIDRGATFYIASPQTQEYLWDDDNNRSTVFAREPAILNVPDLGRHPIDQRQETRDESVHDKESCLPKSWLSRLSNPLISSSMMGNAPLDRRHPPLPGWSVAKTDRLVLVVFKHLMLIGSRLYL